MRNNHHQVRPRNGLVFLFAAMLLAEGGLSAGPVTIYDVIDLGTLGGASSYAYGINNSGDITGFSYVVGGINPRAFFYEGKMHDLGTLGSLEDGGFSVGSQINDSAQIAGTTLDSNGNSAAFIWDFHDGMKSLNLANSAGVGINNSGKVIGVQAGQVFLWSAQAGAQVLPLLSGCSQGNGTALNDAGAAVGYCQSSDNSLQAFAWDSVHGTRPLAPGSFESLAWSIENSGNIFGSIGLGPGVGRAVEWTASGVQFLPLITDGLGNVLNTDAYDSNAQG